MLYIDIQDPHATLSLTGSALVKLIQNNSTPLIDLFVRESLQNSLDAGNPDCDVPYVNVHYDIGKFEKKKLNAYFEKIEDKLNCKYSDDLYDYIAIRDSNTTGLTGPLKSKDIINNNWGKLEKLVYQSCRPQEQLGSGGSWGIGKSIYYRMSSVGLVIYYTRVYFKESGQYESRLCAAMVENEEDENSIIPPVGQCKSGIAWWGAKKEEGSHSFPIIDECEIKQILDIFGISPYQKEQTGTIIIIPYIKPQSLVNHNRADTQDLFENQIENIWDVDLEEYIRISIQRWYAPRLANPFYFRTHENEAQQFKYLRAYVNDKEISYECMALPFKIIQSLYNECVSKNFNCGEPNNLLDIGIQSSSLDYQKIQGNLGQLAYVKLHKTHIIEDDSNVYSYFGINNNESDSNLPIIGMTRRPGMIVNYNSEKWINKHSLPLTGKDEFIVALFVLNSYATFNDRPEYSLEEYIRSAGGEPADHMDWNDHSLADGEKTRACVGNIISKTGITLMHAFAPAEEVRELPNNTGISTLLGQIFHITPHKKGQSSPTVKNKKKKLKKSDIDYTIKKQSYKISGIELEMAIFTKRKASGVKCLFEIDSDSVKFISPNTWEEDEILKTPFGISSCIIHVESYDNTSLDEYCDIFEENSCLQDFDCIMHKTSLTNTVYAFDIHAKDNMPHQFKMNLLIGINLSRRDIRPIIDITSLN